LSALMTPAGLPRRRIRDAATIRPANKSLRDPLPSGHALTSQRNPKRRQVAALHKLNPLLNCPQLAFLFLAILLAFCRQIADILESVVCLLLFCIG